MKGTTRHDSFVLVIKALTGLSDAEHVVGDRRTPPQTSSTS